MIAMTERLAILPEEENIALLRDGALRLADGSTQRGGNDDA